MNDGTNVTVHRPAVMAGRLAGIAAITLVAWIAILAGAYITMIADYPAGRILIVGLAVQAAIIVVWNMARWAYVDRRGGAVIGAIAGLAFGLWALGVLPAGPHALTAVLNKLGDPEGLRRIEQHAGGDNICFDTCPSAVRTYRTDLPHPQAMRRLAAVVQSAGFHVTTRAEQREALRATKGRYELSASFEYGTVGADPRVLYVTIENR